MDVEWWTNPKSWVRHAYVLGPGQGDGALCGRAVLDGEAKWAERGRNCAVCSRRAEGNP